MYCLKYYILFIIINYNLDYKIFLWIFKVILGFYYFKNKILLEINIGILNRKKIFLIFGIFRNSYMSNDRVKEIRK